MRRVACALVIAALASVAPAAQTATPTLPAPSLTLAASLQGLAAAGSRIALADYCAVRVLPFTAQRKPKTPPPLRGLPCQDPDNEDESFVVDLWLGRRSVFAETLNSPSPHGEEYSVYKASLPSGRLRLVDSWGWRDDNPDEPAAGCAIAVVAGGGVVAWARVPNLLGVENSVAKEPACPSSGTTRITLDGAARTRTTVEGSWTLLATDGRRLVLSRLGEDGAPAGQLSVVGLDGKALRAPRFAPIVVKAATSGWLTPEGLVLSTRKGLAGPGWTLRNVYVATVAYGRVFYVLRNALRVRRIRDGVDRKVLTLPRGSREQLVAAGSFGLAVGIDVEKASDESDYETRVYRIGWRVLDGVLPAS